MNNTILVTGGAGFIGANFSYGVTRLRALASTEIGTILQGVML